VDTRTDLTASERGVWQKALKHTFGGKALKDGTDEGVTVAKSVISAAIFYQVEPKRAAAAAYEAYHDTFRWVPPPVAINYQILAFLGRKPKASARDLAFNFPRYFNEEIAPELVRWWDEMLEKGQMHGWEQEEVKKLLRETRDLMRPMMRGRLWQAVQLHARLEAGLTGDEKEDADKELAAVNKELARDFAKVAHTRSVYDKNATPYERYAALTKELGETAPADDRADPGTAARHPSPAAAHSAARATAAARCSGAAPRAATYDGGCRRDSPPRATRATRRSHSSTPSRRVFSSKSRVTWCSSTPSTVARSPTWVSTWVRARWPTPGYPRVWPRLSSSSATTSEPIGAASVSSASDTTPKGPAQDDLGGGP
jgi:hypothetical protein